MLKPKTELALEAQVVPGMRSRDSLVPQVQSISPAATEFVDLANDVLFPVERLRTVRIRGAGLYPTPLVPFSPIDLLLLLEGRGSNVFFSEAIDLLNGRVVVGHHLGKDRLLILAASSLGCNSLGPHVITVTIMMVAETLAFLFLLIAAGHNAIRSRARRKLALFATSSRSRRARRRRPRILLDAIKGGQIIVHHRSNSQKG